MTFLNAVESVKDRVHSLFRKNMLESPLIHRIPTLYIEFPLQSNGVIPILILPLSPRSIVSIELDRSNLVLNFGSDAVYILQ